MKLSPCIMMHFIVENSSDVHYLLLNSLRLEIGKKWSAVGIEIFSMKNYWKIEGSKSIIFGITHQPSLLVREVITVFNITWEYSEGFACDDQSGTVYKDESAVWSQLCFPSECLLLPQVNWVHVYTWPDV